MIRTQDDTFYIQPIPSHLVRSNEFDGHPHVIYRRSVKDNLSSDHHVSGKSRDLQEVNAYKEHDTTFYSLFVSSLRRPHTYPPAFF